MKLYENYKKYAHLINPIFIILLAIVIFQKDYIEHFDITSIDFTSLKKLAVIADGLNGSGTSTITENLVINGNLDVKNAHAQKSLKINDNGPIISYDSTNKILKIPATTEINDALNNRYPNAPSIIVSGCVSTASNINETDYKKILNPIYIPKDSFSFGQQFGLDGRNQWFGYKVDQNEYIPFFKSGTT